MPIHDWTRVDSGLFHAFHQDWIGVLARASTRACYRPITSRSANSRRRSGPRCLDVGIPVGTRRAKRDRRRAGGGVAPPRRRVVRRAEDTIYVHKADRIAVRHRHGRVVAIVEIVSPGNKASTNELRTFVEKTSKLIAQGVHLLVIDLFPPSKRDPQGIHKAIWDQFVEEDFELPDDQRLILAAYDAGPPPVAYVEPIAVGEALPDMPIFLKPDFYVPARSRRPIGSPGMNSFPAPMKRLLGP